MLFPTDWQLVAKIISKFQANSILSMITIPKIGYAPCVQLSKEDQKTACEQFAGMPGLINKPAFVQVEPVLSNRLTVSDTPEQAHKIAASLLPKLAALTGFKKITLRSIEIPGPLLFLIMTEYPIYAAPECVKRMAVLFDAIKLPTKHWPEPLPTDFPPYQQVALPHELFQSQTVLSDVLTNAMHLQLNISE